MLQIFKNIRKNSYENNKWDDENLPHFICNVNVPDQVVNFFNRGSSLVYPAKSFFVAIVYAKCFERFFGQDFRRMLDDEELLPDDPFFVPYGFAADVYDAVLSRIDAENVLNYDSVGKTVRYFKREYDILCS